MIANRMENEQHFFFQIFHPSICFQELYCTQNTQQRAKQNKKKAMQENRKILNNLLTSRWMFDRTMWNKSISITFSCWSLAFSSMHCKSGDKQK